MKPMWVSGMDVGFNFPSIFHVDSQLYNIIYRLNTSSTDLQWSLIYRILCTMMNFGGVRSLPLL